LSLLSTLGAGQDGSMRIRLVHASLLFTLGLSGRAQATVVDPINFSESILATPVGGSSATGMAWAPDGSRRLFVLTKSGVVRIIKAGALLSTPFSSDAVFTNSECGLIGIAFDPSFLQNGYVYLFMTVSATEQQIVRYTASGDVGVSRTVIISGLPTRGNNHDGGGIGFGPDGKLYWAIGDLGNGTGVNSDLTSLAAKIGRANRDGSLPPGNPFADGTGPNHDYIWARGFRNPFTLAFEPGSGALWVDVVGTSYEQIFVVTAGAHAGYNLYENNQPTGFLTPSVVYRTNGSDVRSLAAVGGAVRSSGIATYTTTSAHGFRRGAKITVSGVSDTSFNAVGYVQATPSATSFAFVQPGPNASSGGGNANSENIGGAVTGGDFWSSSAVPLAYRGNYFFGDFNSGRLERVTVGAEQTITSVDHFATGLGGLVDVATGPDGALYTVDIDGSVTRIAFNAVAQDIVATPLQLRFDEGGSAVVNVRLASVPAGNVSVTVGLSGDASVSIASGSALQFSSANWATPQTVLLQAAQDADGSEDLATVTLASSGLSPVTIEAKVTDNSSATAAAVAATGFGHVALLCAGFLGAALLGLGHRGPRRLGRRCITQE
jgi:glucose/arabinose dehydrogenase